MGVTTDFIKTGAKIDALQEKLGPSRTVGVVSWLAGPAHQYLQNRAKKLFSDNATGSDFWPPLTAATAHWRTAQGYGGYSPINRRTDGMYDLMTKDQPDIDWDGSAFYLSYPGAGQNRGKMQTKLKQAQGILPRRGGFSTPRPVIVFEADDLAALTLSFQRWMAQPLGGDR